MKKLTTLAGVVIVLAACAVLGVGIGAGAKGVEIVRGYFVESRPVMEIIDFDDTIGLLDTTTGAVYRLRGNLDNPSARLSWDQRVVPVAGKTSGMLEIQRSISNRPDAVFLVDIVTGKTWILRRRASANASWDPIDIYEKGAYVRK